MYVVGALLLLLVGVCMCWWKEHCERVDADTTMMLAERYHQQQLNDVITHYESRLAPAQSQVQPKKAATWLN